MVCYGPWDTLVAMKHNHGCFYQNSVGKLVLCQHTLYYLFPIPFPLCIYGFINLNLVKGRDTLPTFLYVPLFR